MLRNKRESGNGLPRFREELRGGKDRKEEEEDCKDKTVIKWLQRIELTEIAASARAVHSLFCFAS